MSVADWDIEPVDREDFCFICGHYYDRGEGCTGCKDVQTDRAVQDRLDRKGERHERASR
jgi:hypothetical protein